MKVRNLLAYFGFVLVSQLAGFAGSVFTLPAIPIWYNNLNKPAFTPPSWVFGPVWTTLYFLMGTAAFLVWKNGWQKKQVKSALYIFFFQLILNVFWSYFFFGLQSPALAFYEILLLVVFIVLTMIRFWKVTKTAALLLLPYLLWSSFATFLNLSIMRLN